MQGRGRTKDWDPQTTVSFWVNQASRRLLKIADARLRPLGVSMGQLPVLMALSEGEPLSQKALAQKARVEQPTMAELLSRMQKAGIVQRAVDPEDNRGSLISLSKKGREAVPKVQRTLMEGYEEIFAPFPEAERTTMILLLQKLVLHLGELSVGEAPRARRR